MELTHLPLGANSECRTMLIDLTYWLPLLSSKLNLLPSRAILPDDEVFVKMAIEAARSRGAPAFHVIIAKLKNILRDVEDGVVHEIATVVIGMALTMMECYNYWNAWSAAGMCPYEFDIFYTEYVIQLRRVNTVGDLHGF